MEAALAAAGPYAQIIVACSLILAGALGVPVKRIRVPLQVACVAVQLAAAVLWLATLYNP